MSGLPSFSSSFTYFSSMSTSNIIIRLLVFSISGPLFLFSYKTVRSSPSASIATGWATSNRISGGMSHAPHMTLHQEEEQEGGTKGRTEPSEISKLRKEYSDQGLEINRELIEKGPFGLFRTWLDEAMNANVLEPNAMCLSTVKDGRPSARYVLLKDWDERGFVWYTNYNSRKSDELVKESPDKDVFAALTFWWGDLERSVRIEGSVEKVPPEESDAYFASRPRGSQIGAWTSDQSSSIGSRDALEKQEQEIVAKFANSELIPRPPHWGGFRLIPDKIEFWKGRASRLHDRVLFKRNSLVRNNKSTAVSWEITRLQP